MLIDCSQSMEGNPMESTIYQLMNLVTFASKIKIPFRVFGFADNGSYPKENHIPGDRLSPNEVMITRKSFELREYFSSDMSFSELQRAHINMMGLAMIHGKDLDEYIPPNERLMSTPLDSALYCMVDYISEFRDSENCDIVNLVVLTDDYSADNCMFYIDDTTGKIQGMNKIKEAYIRSKDKRYIEEVSYQRDTTRAFLSLLKRTNNINIAGFFVGSKYNIERKIGNFADDFSVGQAMKDHLREHDYVLSEEMGYDEFI